MGTLHNEEGPGQEGQSRTGWSKMGWSRMRMVQDGTVQDRMVQDGIKMDSHLICHHLSGDCVVEGEPSARSQVQSHPDPSAFSSHSNSPTAWRDGHHDRDLPYQLMSSPVGMY